MFLQYVRYSSMWDLGCEVDILLSNHHHHPPKNEWPAGRVYYEVFWRVSMG
jgi:hypothetical protein